MKKKADDEAQQAAALEEIRKKQTKDIETLQRQIEELNSINDKLSKSKKKLQSEVSKYNLVDFFNCIYYFKAVHCYKMCLKKLHFVLWVFPLS